MLLNKMNRATPICSQVATALIPCWQGECEGTCRLNILDTPSGCRFVGPQGEELVRVNPGAWRATPTGAGGESFLRFWLDVPQGASRNDVSIPSGRVFFTNGCWEAEQLSLAQQALKSLEEEIDALDSETAQAASQSNGLNVVKRALIFREEVLRSERRQVLTQKYSAVAQSMPGPSGCVDGPEGLMVGKRGGLCVKRPGRPFGEEYHILGTFSMAQLETPP